jgi:hypothetical protein
MTILFAEGQPIRSILGAKATSGQVFAQLNLVEVEPKADIAGDSFLSPNCERSLLLSLCEA